MFGHEACEHLKLVEVMGSAVRIERSFSSPEVVRDDVEVITGITERLCLWCEKVRRTFSQFLGNSEKVQESAIANSTARRARKSEKLITADRELK
jgi:hypothetical protein